MMTLLLKYEPDLALIPFLIKYGNCHEFITLQIPKFYKIGPIIYYSFIFLGHV